MKYTYKTIKVDIKMLDDKLNEMANDHWELISVFPVYTLADDPKSFNKQYIKATTKEVYATLKLNNEELKDKNSKKLFNEVFYEK